MSHHQFMIPNQCTRQVSRHFTIACHSNNCIISMVVQRVRHAITSYILDHTQADCIILIGFIGFKYCHDNCQRYIIHLQIYHSEIIICIDIHTGKQYSVYLDRYMTKSMKFLCSVEHIHVGGETVCLLCETSDTCMAAM